jgi:hypothetical protein
MHRLLAAVFLALAGKTVCLEAIAWACGAPASHLRIQSFRDLVSSSQVPSVAIIWKSCAGKELKLQTSLNKDRERYVGTCP